MSQHSNADLQEAEGLANGSSYPMSCPICNLFTGIGPLREDLNAPVLPDSRRNRNHIRRGIPRVEFEGSSEACYVCGILASGTRDCLVQHGINPSDVDTIDIEFYYLNYRGQEDDRDKYLSCKLKDGTVFQVELFALEGRLLTRFLRVHGSNCLHVLNTQS